MSWKNGKSKPDHGDVLKFDGGQSKISHYGIYNKEDNSVIHKTGPPGGMEELGYGYGKSTNSQVRSDSYARMAKDYDSVTVHNRPQDRRYSADRVVQNAEARIGETSYNLVSDNCETFSRQCETGRTESDQVDSTLSWAWEKGKAVMNAYTRKF